MNRSIRNQVVLLVCLVCWQHGAMLAQAPTSFGKLLTKFGEKLMENMSEDRKEKEYQLLIPKDEYAVYTFKDKEGMPAVAMVNIGLRGFDKKEVFGWYCSMIIDFEELAENGMPTSEESTLVFDWLEENFGAVSKCPIAVQKYANDDDWDSHVYILNREKFLAYFHLRE